MAVTVNVPLNTMLADLDETVRQLLKRELDRHGFDGVEIAFEAPSKDWSASLSVPTVNLFLYDLREAKDFKPIDWEPRQENGKRVDSRPPLRLDASYAVTAWTREVQDEHRLLSQALAVLYGYPVLPDDILAGTLANQPKQRYPLVTRVAQPRGDGGAEFWSAVGGTFKASVDYCVTVSCDAGTVYQRGPEVRTQTIRVRDVDAPRAAIEETHRIGGVVTHADGGPVAEAWVMMPDGGGFAVTDADGRFLVERLRAGSHRFVARAPDGSEGEVEVEVPSGPVDLVVGVKTSKTPARKKR
jgi:hypothetical protein